MKATDFQRKIHNNSLKIKWLERADKRADKGRNKGRRKQQITSFLRVLFGVINWISVLLKGRNKGRNQAGNLTRNRETIIEKRLYLQPWKDINHRALRSASIWRSLEDFKGGERFLAKWVNAKRIFVFCASQFKQKKTWTRPIRKG